MLEALVKHLAQNAKLETSIDVERFEATLGQIASLNDPAAIGLLVAFFRDDSKFPDTMFSIIHVIERFDDSVYVTQILKALPSFWNAAPYWASVLHFRIFNHAPSRGLYREKLAQSNPTIRATAKKLLTTMRDNEPQFRQVCDEMLPFCN